MKTKSLIVFATILWISITLFSCGSKKEDPTPNPSKSRKVKFEVSGNFSGRIDCNVLTASGGITYETISALPWSKEITYAASVSTLTFAVVGVSGMQGQNITIKVYVGDNLISTTPTTATANGNFTVGIPPYVF